jgi:hypothetical protein
MKNQLAANGIFTIIVFILIFLLAYWIAPEERIVEQVVEVEKVIEIPVTNQDIYFSCSNQARVTLYSTWNGEPKVGTTPENTRVFIDDCFNKLKK